MSWRTCKASQPLSVQNYLDSGRDLILRSFSCLKLPHLGAPDSAYRISVMARGCAHGMRRSGRGTFQSLSTLSPCSLICASRSLPVTVAHSALAPLGASKCTQHPGENTETVQMTGDGMALKHADVHARDVRGAQARACLQRRTFGINEVRRSRVAYATSTWGDATSAAQRQSLAMSCRASLCDAWYRTGGQPRAPAA